MIFTTLNANIQSDFIAQNIGFAILETYVRHRSFLYTVKQAINSLRTNHVRPQHVDRRAGPWSSFPSRTFLATRKGGETNCPVCLEPFAAHEFIAHSPYCSLLTHLKCLRDWGAVFPSSIAFIYPRRSPSSCFCCPQCRRSVSLADLPREHKLQRFSMKEDRYIETSSDDDSPPPPPPGA
jgi:hypothetical protein